MKGRERSEKRGRRIKREELEKRKEAKKIGRRRKGEKRKER